MTSNESLHLCLLDLASQLRQFLVSPVVEQTGSRSALWQLYDAARDAGARARQSKCDDLHMCLVELADQLWNFLSEPGDDDAHKNKTWRLRDTALRSLGEARTVLDALKLDAIERPSSVPPMWLPSSRMQEQLQARRERRRTDGGFSLRDPRRPRP